MVGSKISSRSFEIWYWDGRMYGMPNWFTRTATFFSSVITLFCTRVSPNSRPDWCCMRSASWTCSLVSRPCSTSISPRRFFTKRLRATIADSFLRSGAVALGGTLEILLVRAARAGVVPGDLVVLVEFVEALVHRAHAQPRAGLDVRHDLVALVVADQRADGRVGDHDLRRHGAAAAVHLRQQLLTEHAFQHEGQLGADLVLLEGREHVDDAVDGLDRRRGVQRGEGQVTGLGQGQPGLDGLLVTHFADQHHVRVLAQDAPQRGVEALGVGADLALVDQAALVAVHELDRVLDGDDVVLHVGVDVVDHRRQRGGLARTGGAGDQHQALGQFAQLGADLLGHTELVEIEDLVRDRTHHPADRAALEEDVDAEAPDAGEAEAHVQLQVLLEAGDLLAVEHRVHQLLGVLRGQRLQAGQLRQGAVDAHPRRRVGGDVQIGPPALDHRAQELFHGDHRPPLQVLAAYC